MKLFRPYVSVSIRLQVAERQCLEAGISAPYPSIPLSDGAKLHACLYHLFFDRKFELHHRPALVNRPWNKRKHDYDPPANSPKHLIYLAADDHDIETRVHGVGAQRSDLGQRRYNKRVERNKAKRVAQPKVQKLGKTSTALRGRSAWPPKGARKIATRKFRNPSTLRGME